VETIRGFLDSELGYVALLFTLFIIPKILQRWRIPSAATSLALGAVAGMGLGLFQDDRTVHLLAAFGIVALFLFAGLDVSGHELRREWKVIVQHLAVRALIVGAGALGAMWAFGLEFRAAALVSLALFTPSTGFILDSLDKFGLTKDERFWVKSKAIATEILALAVLFVTLQSASPQRLIGATLALAALVAVLPTVFRFFARALVPYAPKSEFTFLLMMAILCAYATRKLGAYYLVGAFVVGLAARRFRDELPAIASERMLHAVEVFAAFFVPFYFFGAGLDLRRDDFSPTALALGAVFFLVAVPLSVGTVALHRRLALKERFEHSIRVALPMLPTLIFTLVLATILREQFAIPEWLYGGLLVYTLLNTLVPGFVFGVPDPVFDEPELSPDDEPETAA